MSPDLHSTGDGKERFFSKSFSAGALQHSSADEKKTRKAQMVCSDDFCLKLRMFEL
jgi:hypothetical protein